MANLGRDGRDGRERERRETRHNNSPPTKKLRLRLGWGRGGVWVKVGLGWGSAIFYEYNFVVSLYHLRDIRLN